MGRYFTSLLLPEDIQAGWGKRSVHIGLLCILPLHPTVVANTLRLISKSGYVKAIVTLILIAATNSKTCNPTCDSMLISKC